jgi:hypothetical protein
MSERFISEMISTVKGYASVGTPFTFTKEDAETMGELANELEALLDNNEESDLGKAIKRVEDNFYSGRLNTGAGIRKVLEAARKYNDLTSTE